MADKKISALTAASTPLAGTEVLPIVQSGTTKQVSVANLTAGRAVSASSLALTGSPLPTTSGGTGLTSFTANGIVYASSTSALTTGSALTFDGTNLSNTGAAPGIKAVITGGTVYTTLASDGVYSAGTDLYLFAPSGKFLSLYAGAAERMRVAASGDITYSTGNLIQGTAAKGVNFTANTPAAGMTSQLLNWYEEGTWTPTMTSASGTTTVNSSSGLYTRMGRCVFIEWFVDYTTNASVSTSNFTFGGLPFTSNANQTARAFVAFSGVTGNDYNDGVIYVQLGATTALWTSRAVDQSSRTNAQLYFSASYFV